MFSRELSLKRRQRFLGAAGRDIAPTVRDAMDVDIYADARLSARDAKH
jgi:hypothetical protein